MTRKTTTNPATLGQLNPGDTCDVFGYGRVKVTGKLDCGVLFRCIVGAILSEPDVLPMATPVVNVAARAATTDNKATNTDPLLGGAR